MNEPRQGWHLREVWFDDGEPTMHREPSKPEPVAWMAPNGMVNHERIGHFKIPLYTAPHSATHSADSAESFGIPQRTWIDPSSAEIKALWNATKKPSEFAALLLAKFKEKNS